MEYLITYIIGVSLFGLYEYNKYIHFTINNTNEEYE